MRNNVKKMIIALSKPFVLPATRMALKRMYTNELTSVVPTEKRVLILAPHVDDETIGAGGTICTHIEQGATVRCVYLTDGGKSQSELPREELIEERKKEAERVQQILGIHELEYYHLPDGEVESNKQTQQLLVNTITEFAPDVIYCPTLVDCHTDHVATGRILSDTLKQLPGEEITIRLYEINCLLPVDEINCVIDISNFFAKKQQAVKIFESQAIDFDGFIELSKVKASLLKHASVDAVETFMELSRNDFIEFYDLVDKEGFTYADHFKQVNKSVTLLWGTLQNKQLKNEIYRKRNQE